MKKNIHHQQKPDLEKLNQEIEEELLHYLESGKPPQEEQEVYHSSIQTIFQFVMTSALVLVVVINIALIIYKLFN